MTSDSSAQVAAKLNPILEKYTSTSLENHLPLAIAAYVTKNGGLSYLGAAGVKDLANPEDKVDVDTTLAFYSTSKAITTTALVQLLEQGKISSLDDPVEKYVPEVKDIQVLEGFDENDEPILVEQKNKPTIRNLLTHTAGFSYFFFSNKYYKLYEKTGSPNPLKSEWQEFNKPFIYQPGTKWHYGVNIDWVGKVVQSVSGLTLDEYVKQNIFKPLGANSLTFVRTDDHYKNHAEIHQRTENTHGKIFALKNLHPEIPEFHAGGHGLFGKLVDYMKFLEIFLHDGKSPQTGAQILQPHSIENYSFKNLLPEGVHVEGTLEHSAPPLSNKIDLFDNLPKDGQGWTASFHKIDVALPTGRSAGSYTWCGLPNLYYWIDPKKGVAGFFATQLFPFYDKTSLEATAEFEKAVYSLVE